MGGSGDRQVGRDDRLARAALRREHRDDAALARAGLELAGGLRGLLDHEEHVLLGRRQPEDVRDAGVERPADELTRGCGRREHDRRAGVLAQARQLLAGLRRAVVDEHRDVERLRLVAARELLELEAIRCREHGPERRRRVALTGERDAQAAISGHWRPPRSLRPRPAPSACRQRGSTDGAATSSRRSSAASRGAGPAHRSAAARPRDCRSSCSSRTVTTVPSRRAGSAARSRVECSCPPSGFVTLPTTSTRLPCLRVPASSWCASPGQLRSHARRPSGRRAAPPAVRCRIGVRRSARLRTSAGSPPRSRAAPEPVIAPEATLFAGSVRATNHLPVASLAPVVPIGMSRLATNT